MSSMLSTKFIINLDVVYTFDEIKHFRLMRVLTEYTIVFTFNQMHTIFNFDSLKSEFKKFKNIPLRVLLIKRDSKQLLSYVVRKKAQV